MGNVSVPPKTAPYGTWESPISASMLASERNSLLQVAPSRRRTESNLSSLDKIYFTEARATEQGRHCIVECTFLPGGSPHFRDALPEEYSARTRVHGYGGGAFACQYRNTLIFSDAKTNGVYSLDPQNQLVDCIIPGNDKVFYADFDACDEVYERWILAVCEDHRPEIVTDSIVAIDTITKTVHVIVSGANFYASPRLCTAEGRQAYICWMQWNHPHMPWTGSQLCLALWDSGNSSNQEQPRIASQKLIAGASRNEGIAQPRWNHADRSLLFCSNRSGYWQIYCLEPGRDKPTQVSLQGMEEGNFAGPEWWLGSSTFSFLDQYTIVALWTKDAIQCLVEIDLRSSTYSIPQLSSIDNPSPSIQAVSDNHCVIIGSTTDGPEALYSVSLTQPLKMTVIKSSSTLEISPRYFSTLKSVSFPRTCSMKFGDTSHAMFMRPLHPDYIAPSNTLPPLVLYMHGGPTIHVGPGLSLAWQYWTTRGYALAAVNYTGSSGYSRDYQTELDGQWGVADVADAASCVEHLVSVGLVDKTRVGIVGGSAGGYACLQALCLYPDKFAGGISLYGVSDVKALIRDTHKFESHYVDRLLFGAHAKLSDKEKGAILHERSPLYHAKNIKAATLLLQGMEDDIVPPNQAQRMIAAIKEHNGNAEVILFEGEGHGFAKAKNVETSIVEQEKWWRKTLVRDG